MFQLDVPCCPLVLGDLAGRAAEDLEGKWPMPVVPSSLGGEPDLHHVPKSRLDESLDESPIKCIKHVAARSAALLPLKCGSSSAWSNQ